MKKYLIMVMAICLMAIGIGAGLIGTASANTDSQGATTVTVDSPADVPADAVLVSEHTSQNCSTTTRWRLTVPGNDQTSHQEFRYKRDVPGTAEQSHMEYRYQREVQDYKTQYHFRKFTHTKTRPPHGQWSEYGPWTPWVPETHESWQDSDAPLGAPEYHGSGTYQNGTQWYREWQAQFDGETRQVEDGTHLETTDWVTEAPAGDGWVQIDERKVVDVEAVPGYTEYFVLDGAPSQNEADASWIQSDQLPANEGWMQFDERTVVDTEESPDVVTDYVYNDGVTCDKPTPPKHHTPPSPPASPDVPTVIDAGL